jgi:recombination protein RecT
MNTQNAVAKIDNSPASLVTQYRDDFAQLLPSHINADMWVRLATGALRKDKALAAAAQANPGSFMAALSDAARLGLEPATSQYYLTPRKVKGRDEVLGIVGYQGLIELMYRAGAVSSIVAECVYSGDTFTYTPGVHERPIHGIDWDADSRGDLRLVYAYAVMKDGATSKVVVLNKAAIAKIKGSSSSARSDYSPWSTHPDAMWLKSAIRQLSKYVPTSAEYIREQLRAVRDVAAEPLGTSTLPARDVSDILHTDDYDVDTETGEMIYEAEILGDES